MEFDDLDLLDLDGDRHVLYAIRHILLDSYYRICRLKEMLLVKDDTSEYDDLIDWLDVIIHSFFDSDFDTLISWLKFKGNIKSCQKIRDSILLIIGKDDDYFIFRNPDLKELKDIVDRLVYVLKMGIKRVDGRLEWLDLNA